MNFGIDVIVHPGRIGRSEAIFPGCIGDIHKANSAAGIGGNVGVVVRRVFGQRLDGSVNLLDQVAVKKWLLTLGRGAAARSEAAGRELHGERRRAGPDPAARGDVSRGVREGRALDAARTLGRRDGDREGGPRAHRDRLHHRRNDSS